MIDIYNFFMDNIYLYICIIIVLLILFTILLIITTNKKNREKLKKEFIEAEKLNTEIENKQVSNNNNELEEILKKMQEDINVKPEDVVKKFEEEQEKKAIISYKELVDNVNAGKIEVEDDEDLATDYVENLNLDVNEEPVLNVQNDANVTPDMVKEAIQNISSSSVKEEPKKFKNSAIISPIYGVMEEKLEYPTIKKNLSTMDILNTKEYNELSEEIKKQEDFLQALKNFRNNL